MKTLAILAAAVLTFAMAADSAEAKRLGGAGSSGMQRSQVTQPASPPAQSAPGSTTTPVAPGQAAAAPGAAAATAAPAAAATARHSWAGPVAGLAAGLGLAALASYLGFGEALANIMLVVLVGLAVLALIGFILRRRAAGAVPAAAAAVAARGMRPLGGTDVRGRSGGVGTANPGQAAATASFDMAAFIRTAKAKFLDLQSANDAGDLQRLREYLTPQVFEVVEDELRTRGAAVQNTQVFGLEAQVIEVADEAGNHIVSVRFTGRVRGQPGEVPEDLDEVWHLTKPRKGGCGWVIAGIQQVPQAA